MIVDHIKPLKKGGLDIPENRVLLCRRCHDNRHKVKVGTGSQGVYSYGKNKTPIASFYIAGFETYWQNFREVCVREGTTASKKLKEFIERYLAVHNEGNPQLLLMKFIEEAKLRECFFCRGHFDRLW